MTFIKLHNNINFIGDTTFNSSLCVNSISTIQNNLLTTNIYPITDTITIDSDIINIGSSNSIVTLNGTTNFIASTNLGITNKLINLNYSALTSNNFDNGGNCGIKILGTNGDGYLQTSNDGLRYIIKAPLDPSFKYIATVDNNNNLNVSGASLFQKSLTVNSTLYVLGNAIMQGDAQINMGLSVSNITLFVGNSTMLGNINVNDKTLLVGDTTSLLSLTVAKNAILNETNINSQLIILGDTFFCNKTTVNSSLNLFGDSEFVKDYTINSNIIISSNTILNGAVSINSDLNIFGNSIINGSSNIQANLLVSGNANIYGSTTIQSNLYIAGNSLLNNNVTLGKNITFYNSTTQTTQSKFNILGNIISPLSEFKTNSLAAANDVPLWGFYRTGGIVKIRVSITPPHLLLIGPSTITINLGSDYIEQGVNVVENAYLDESNDIVPYLISIDNATTTNIIDTPIPITTTTIINIQVLPLGTYTITYSATDPVGNNVTKIRILSII